MSWGRELWFSVASCSFSMNTLASPVLMFNGENVCKEWDPALISGWRVTWTKNYALRRYETMHGYLGAWSSIITLQQDYNELKSWRVLKCQQSVSNLCLDIAWSIWNEHAKREISFHHQDWNHKSLDFRSSSTLILFQEVCVYVHVHACVQVLFDHGIYFN